MNTETTSSSHYKHQEVWGCAVPFFLTSTIIVTGLIAVFSSPETFIAVPRFVESTAEHLAKLIINKDALGLIVLAIPVLIFRLSRHHHQNINPQQ